MRITAMEIGQNTQDDFEPLRIRCVEERLEEEGTVVFERNIVAADRSQRKLSGVSRTGRPTGTPDSESFL